MKDYSLLGCMLLATSAITAAFVPSKKEDAAWPNFNGIMTLSSDFYGTLDITCRQVDLEYVEEPNCSWTITGDYIHPGFFPSSTASPGDPNSISALNSMYTASNTTRPELEDDIFSK